VQFLGNQLSTGQLTDFCRDFLLHTTQWARGIANWQLLALDLDHAINGVRSLCAGATSTDRIRWSEGGPHGIDAADWMICISGVKAALNNIQKSLDGIVQHAPDLTVLHARVCGHLERLDLFLQPVIPGFTRWLDIGAQVRMVLAPLDIASCMRSRVFGSPAETPARGSWIFTSATLGGDANMTLFVDSCGLGDAQLLQVESPFNYMNQAALYIPADIPKPSDPSHSTSVAMLAAQAAEVLGGRTLVLTTTLRAMRVIGDALTQYFGPNSGIEVLVQGQASKRDLLARFCAQTVAANQGCVLVASASFWEGVDISGDALQLLVIDKLPFVPPSDPLVEARVRQLESEGKNAFRHFHLPQATIALKQGAGRLIRRETDRGVLVVCDVRLVQMSYGRKMISALPAMPQIQTAEQFHEVLISLTKPSTMDPERR
jgi:ATP-dependent DNA helicase DinG